MEYFPNPTLENNSNLIKFSLTRETWKRKKQLRLINKLCQVTKGWTPKLLNNLPFQLL